MNVMRQPLSERAPTADNAGLSSEADNTGCLSALYAAPETRIRREGRLLLLKDGDPTKTEAELLAMLKDAANRHTA